MVLDEMRNGLVLIVLIALTISSISIVQQSYGEITIKNRVLIIIAPGLEADELINRSAILTNITGFNFTSIMLNSTKILVSPSPPYDQMYYQYILLTGESKGFEQLYLNDTVIDKKWLAIDHNKVVELWEPNSTVFVNFKLIDPSKYGLATNPYYNLTGFYIPPTILTIEINSSTLWSLLNITINLTFRDQTYRISFNGSVLDKPIRDLRFVNNVTESFLINITRRVVSNGYVIEPGLYRLKVRLVAANESHAVIFIPGFRCSEYWISAQLGIYDKPVYVVSREVFDTGEQLGNDTLYWLLDEISGFYKDLFIVAARRPNVGLIIYNYDLLTEPSISSYAERREKAVLTLGELIVQAVRRDYNVILYVPYVLKHINESVTISQGLEIIVPGFLRVKNDYSKEMLLNLLLNGTFKDLRFISFDNEVFAIVSYGNKAINNTLVQQGYLLIYPSLKTVSERVLSTDNIIGYLLAFSRSYGFGLSDALENINYLSYELARAKSKIAELNQTVENLNSTINSLKRELGDTQAKAQLLENQISDLNSTIDSYVRREKEMKMFLSVGIASIVVLNILLYVIGTRMFRKEK